MDARRLMCTTIYSCSCSPCGKFVAAADNFGFISIFNFEKALAFNNPKWQKSVFCFKAHDGPIHSLLTVKDSLVSGGTGAIAAWKWSDILERKPAMTWTLDEPCQASEGSFSSNDVNALACDGKKIYAGRDDNTVCIWDLATRKCEQKLTGHNDYIHDIAITSASNGLVSASEDGSVKIWDLRASQCTNTFEPHLHKDASRPQFGKWISCVAVDENGQWMVCGGGPQLSLWHLRSLNRAALLERPEFNPYVVKFHENVIVAGGNGNTLHHWYTNGSEKASIPCTVGTVFSLSFNEKRKAGGDTPLVAAGSSHKLDIFCNLSYRSHMLSL